MHISEMQSKIDKKRPFFETKNVWSCSQKICILRREYLSSGLNVLTNSLEISDVTKADIFQLNLSLIHGKIKKIVVPCWLQQCFEPVNTFITEWCAEARPFRRLSKHLFRMQ